MAVRFLCFKEDDRRFVVVVVDDSDTFGQFRTLPGRPEERFELVIR